MKFPVGIVGLIMLLTLFTAGFFPMILIGALSGVAITAANYHGQSTRSLSGRSYKALK